MNLRELRRPSVSVTPASPFPCSRSLILLLCTVALFLYSFFHYNRAALFPELGGVEKLDVNDSDNTIKKSAP